MCFCTVLYNATLYTASAGCCVNKLCAVNVSPVLRLYYCQHSVPSCEDYAKSFVVFAQFTASRVCREGAMITPLVIFILLFLLFLPIPTCWELMSTGSSILTASKSHFPVYAPWRKASRPTE